MVMCAHLGFHGKWKGNQVTQHPPSRYGNVFFGPFQVHYNDRREWSPQSTPYFWSCSIFPVNPKKKIAAALTKCMRLSPSSKLSDFGFCVLTTLMTWGRAQTWIMDIAVLKRPTAVPLFSLEMKWLLWRDHYLYDCLSNFGFVPVEMCWQLATSAQYV